jgi:hypothetical protein
MTVKFNHIKNSETGKLFCTVCTIELPSETLIGVAICSGTDNFSRKIGRELSAKRAQIALMSRRITLPIYPYRTSSILLLKHPQICRMLPYPFKSIYLKKE